MSARVAVITGSAQGIGKAIAIRLAKDGFKIVVSDVSNKFAQLQEVVQEIQALGARAIAVVCDVTVEAEVQKLVEEAVVKFGSVDVMVANAGVMRFSPLTSLKEEEWDLIHSVNVKGTLFCYKKAAEQMIKQGRGGRIISGGSIAGKMGTAGAAAYCASKFAIRGLTQSAAAELRPHNITVNSYAPGSIKTAMFDNCVKSFEDLGMIEESKMLKATPLGSPEEVAALVSYLAGEESRFMTGQSLSINGGLYFE